MQRTKTDLTLFTSLLYLFLGLTAFSSTEPVRLLANSIPEEKLPNARIYLEDNFSDIAEGAEYEIIVKFRPKFKLQADRKTRSISSDILSKKRLNKIRTIIHSREITFAKLLKLSPSKISKLKARSIKSGHSDRGLDDILKCNLPGKDRIFVIETAKILSDLPEVEYVFIQTKGVPPPPPVDIPPTTPDFSFHQTYKGADPGLNFDYITSLGASGAGVRLLDCEFGWNYSHEDLPASQLHPQPGKTIASHDFDDHGTAVIGITIAAVNAYGMTGVAPDAEVFTFPESTVEAGWDRPSAIADAIASATPGDVILLEMQIWGPTSEFVMAEYHPVVWDLVKTATDSGIIVVAAAGNGNVNTDAQKFSAYHSRGDSGAIIVGANNANSSHSRLTTSSYGSRINVQSWGISVATLGYGNLETVGGDINQRYTDFFGGTSSASALVAAASVSIQSLAIKNLNKRLSPEEMRNLLVDTGIHSEDSVLIGPAIDLKAAALHLLDINLKPVVEAGEDQTISVGSATRLQGSVNDDNRPSNNLSYNWSQFSGPANITFGNNKLLTTTVSFSEPGRYVLQLKASDGELNSTDNVEIQVTDLHKSHRSSFAKKIQLTLADDNYAYLFVGNKLNILDLQEKANPVTLSSHLDLPGSNDINDGVLDGNYLYVATGTSNGLYIIDVSDKANPTIKGQNTTLKTQTEIAVESGYAYAIGQYGIGDFGVSIIDVRDGAQPVEVGSYQLNFFSEAIDVLDNFIYVSENSSIKILDVSSKTNPTLVGSFTLGSRIHIDDIIVEDNRAYVTYGGSTIFATSWLGIFDITNKNPITRISSLQLPNHGKEITKQDNLLIIADLSDGVRIIDITDETAPVTIDGYGLNGKIYSAAFSNHRVYAGSEYGEFVILSRPEANYLTYDKWGLSIPWETNNPAKYSDPDSDNIKNLMEYALGLDPLTPSVIDLPSTEVEVIPLPISELEDEENPLPTSEFEEESGEKQYNAMYIYRRNKLAEDLNYEVYYSTNLKDWFPIRSRHFYEEPINNTSANNNDTFRMVKLRMPLNGDSQMFFRLVVNAL